MSHMGGRDKVLEAPEHPREISLGVRTRHQVVGAGCVWWSTAHHADSNGGGSMVLTPPLVWSPQPGSFGLCLWFEQANTRPLDHGGARSKRRLGLGGHAGTCHEAEGLTHGRATG